MTQAPRRDPKGTVHARVAKRVGVMRGPLQAGVDVAAWAVGLSVAMFVRFEFVLDTSRWGRFEAASLALAIAIAAALQIAIGMVTGLYRGKFRYGSFEEVTFQALSVFAAACGLAAIGQAITPNLLPLSVVIFGAFLAAAGMCAARYLWRLSRERAARPSKETATPVVVFGAGEGGAQVITAMLRNPASPYFPVALLDDDPMRRKLTIMGVRVAGTRDALPELAKRLGVKTLLIAIPSASADLVREMSERALKAKMHVLVLPPIGELFGAAVGVGDIRKVTEADLLGRRVIRTDVGSIAGFLTGKRVLVTGAGGSIGSELCYQVARFGPSKLVMLDRDESALHALQLRLDGRAMLDTEDLAVADIRDEERMGRLFDYYRPEVVFHAAALKHLPLLERHPTEAHKTNVLGTFSVLEAAGNAGVERFVNISTDKAADPCSVLGYTKRIAEMLTAGAAQEYPGTYLSVRFGNVLGSRGSVLTAFRSQIASGGPLTVTHPDVTRYFMTVEEAVELVIQGGAVGQDGEALVLDMGEPVRIDDVARRLAAEADRPIEVVYTGLRGGEKLHEVLLGEREQDERREHPLISHVDVPTICPVEVREATEGRWGPDLVEQLRALAWREAGDSARS